jgi:NAD(P)-dependent dehydrogenase (short-subunit alcohol dehydrogenase family)
MPWPEGATMMSRPGMQGQRKTMIVTGASQGIGAGVTKAFLERGYNVVNASLPMITKGGLAAITRSLAMEYAKEGIRFNAVAPGTVDTPMHATDPKGFLESLSPMGTISDVDDIVEAIVYLTEARHVTGEVLHVDSGAHNGKW